MEEVQITATLQRILNKIEELGHMFEKNYRNPLSELWLDTQEACDALKVSKRTLQSYREQRSLPFSRIGGKIYYRYTDIEAHFLKNYSKPLPKQH